MSERNISSDLKTFLKENKPYTIAHLIKFERPNNLSTFSTEKLRNASDYVYMTDAGRDITFDDGSLSHINNFTFKQFDSYPGSLASNPYTYTANGPQTYVAKRIQSVGAVNEGIEAKASSMSIKIDANALSPQIYIPSFFYNSSGYFETNIDLSDRGFTIGDKVSVSQRGQDNGTFIITRFTAEGHSDHPNRVYVEVVDVDNTLSSSSTRSNTFITLISEELNTIFRGSKDVVTSNYVNREVSIYRLYIDPQTNQIVGGIPGFYDNVYDPKGSCLLFKGIITNASFNEAPGSSSSISWTISSHWGFFNQVTGRVTSDSEHRALTETGVSDRDVILRQAYAEDLGFEHSERSINLIATYNKEITKHRIKKEKNAIGITTDYSMEEYTDYVPTDIDLSLNLSAKSLPVIYGVRKVDSIPVFFDNQKSKTDHLYAAFAICEGPIGGLYDIILDGKSTICSDAADFSARSEQNDNNTVDVLCQGRADKGDVLVGTNTDQGAAKYVAHVYDYDGLSSTDLVGLIGFENNLFCKSFPIQMGLIRFERV